jgi:DNA repair protein RadA
MGDIKKVEDLPGVGAATAEKLRDAGFADLVAIAVASVGELVDASGVTESNGRKIINAAREAMDMGFEDGNSILKKREAVTKISTGSKAFDAMLAGGIETSAITEVYAQYASGKTQLAHILVVNAQKQIPGSIAVYIDTEGTFRPERIKELAEARGLDAEEVLKNIKVARAYNSDHQMLLAEKVDDIIKSGETVSVVVVDSLTAHFRAEFIGRGTLAERQQKLNKHMHTLARLADVNNLTVFVTNQVMAKPDQFFGDPTEAIGGHIVGHNSTFRIYLRKGKKGSRVAKLVDAPNLADNECSFMIDQGGFKDL